MTNIRDAARRRRVTFPHVGGLHPRRSPFPLAALAAVGVATVALGVVPAAPAGARSSPTVVKAVETDFHIALSKSTFNPGKYTFVAQIKGQVTHSLEITGPGLSNARAKNISPGHSAKLTVTFKKGAYDIFCPIPGHKAMGMNVNIVVGGAATTSSGGGTTTTSHSGPGGGYGY